MNILAFDTSTDKFSLAIYKKNKIIYYYQKILNKDYSKKLIPIIQESLKKTRIKIEEIDFISISLGPGSFTGIRLGIAAAKGIALPYKIKILGFDNMELIADSIRKKVEKKLIIVKSKKKDFYYQSFFKNKPKNKISFLSNYNLQKIEKDHEVFIYGIYDRELEKEIKVNNKNKTIHFNKKNFNAKSLINLSLINYKKATNKNLEPIYVYDHYAKK